MCFWLALVIHILVGLYHTEDGVKVDPRSASATQPEAPSEK